jgi:hypothetical protein
MGKLGSEVLLFAVCSLLALPLQGASYCGLFGLGDIHGDLYGAINALRSAGLVNKFGNWTGGCAVVVQTGDIADRGPQVLATYQYFDTLRHEALAAGGRVVMLIGNHELLNFEGETGYVHRQELAHAGGPAGWASLFGRNGVYRRMLADNPAAVLINSVVFVHAGILPQFAALGIDGINKLAREAIDANRWNQGVLGDTGPFWTREIITQAMNNQCSTLSLSLSLLGAERMVVGHTIQQDKKFHTYCDGALVAIDIGMSRAIFGEHPGVVELVQEDVRKYYGEPAQAEALLYLMS